MAAIKDKKLILESIRKYVDELRKRNIDITAAYLFGSYTKGKLPE